MLRWSSDEARHDGAHEHSRTIGPAGATDEPPTCRQHDRTAFTGPVTVIPCPSRTGRTPVDAIITDLSPAGAALVLPMELHEREQLILLLPTPGSAEKRAVLCAVIHCRSAGPGRFAIGSRFIRILSATAAASHSQEHEDAGTAMLKVHDVMKSITLEGIEHLRQLKDRLGKCA